MIKFSSKDLYDNGSTYKVVGTHARSPKYRSHMLAGRVRILSLLTLENPLGDQVEEKLMT